MILKNTDNEIFKSLKDLLGSQLKKIIVVPHENPDGDAIGSAIGLGEVLKNFGHDVKIIVPNSYPSFLKWFSSEIEILVYERKKNIAINWLQEAQVLICVDFNEAKRAARMEKKLLSFPGPKLLIDHHPDPSDFCDYTISEPSYSSTAELIFDVVANLNLEKYLNSNAAEALYTGIMTDTGSFSHNISRPNTFKVVAKLMEWGINAEKIHASIYHNFSAKRMKLLGHCLDKKMEIFPEYRSAVIWISQKELKEFDYSPGDTEGFVNYPLSIDDIVFSAIFIEKKDYVKASFRSKGNFPVNEFSKEHFSGGGHRNAAGGETKMSIEESVKSFRQLLADYKHQLLETKI